MGWPVEADGLRRLLLWLKDSYPGLPPVYITENGRACDDVVDEDGQVRTPTGSATSSDHLGAVAQAAAEGVDVRGFYAWSLHGQLRVGRGLRQAVRHRARRLRDAEADAQVQLRLVPRRHRRAPLVALPPSVPTPGARG